MESEMLDGLGWMIIESLAPAGEKWGGGLLMSFDAVL